MEAVQDSVQSTVEAVQNIIQGESQEEQQKEQELVARLNVGFLLSGLALACTFAVTVAYLLQRLHNAQRKAEEDRSSFLRVHVPLLMLTGAALWVLLFRNPWATDGGTGKNIVSAISEMSEKAYQKGSSVMGITADDSKEGSASSGMLNSMTSSVSAGDKHDAGIGSTATGGPNKKKFWAGFLIGALAALSIYNQANDANRV